VGAAVAAVAAAAVIVTGANRAGLRSGRTFPLQFFSTLRSQGGGFALPGRVKGRGGSSRENSSREHLLGRADFDWINVPPDFINSFVSHLLRYIPVIAIASTGNRWRKM
jgi:hypothetical protein